VAVAGVPQLHPNIRVSEIHVERNEVFVRHLFLAFCHFAGRITAYPPGRHRTERSEP
jgi:hypothetical protein